MNMPELAQKISSREIAEMAGKPHNDLLKAIRKMEDSWQKISGCKFALAEYKSSTGKNFPMYLLTKTECLYIATKFNDEARAKLVLRWEELENAQNDWLMTAEGHLKQAIKLLRIDSNRVEKEAESLRRQLATLDGTLADIDEKDDVISNVLSSIFFPSKTLPTPLHIDSKLPSPDWRHDFQGQFGEYTLSFIDENIDLWITVGEIHVKDFNKTHADAHKKIGTRRLLHAISLYCRHTGTYFGKHRVVKRDGSAIRVHIFGKRVN